MAFPMAHLRIAVHFSCCPVACDPFFVSCVLCLPGFSSRCRVVPLKPLPGIFSAQWHSICRHVLMFSFVGPPSSKWILKMFAALFGYRFKLDSCLPGARLSIYNVYFSLDSRFLFLFSFHVLLFFWAGGLWFPLFYFFLVSLACICGLGPKALPPHFSARQRVDIFIIVIIYV